MSRGVLKFLFIVAGLYGLLHFVLGSSPVQRRVVEEIRQALATLGIDLGIESIEFSALTPRIYLNRVTLRPIPKTDVPLTDPLAIDKIKIEFQPLALISKRIVISEVVLFHPKVILPDAGRLYKRVLKFLESKKKPSMKGGSFTVVLERFGVVDALINVISKDPSFSVRSRSFTAFVENGASGQQNVTVESNNMEIVRGPLQLDLMKVDVDVDLTDKSVRLNRAIVEGGDLAINLKGSTSLPLSVGGKKDAFQGSYEVRVPLDLLNRIPEANLPKLQGILVSQGNVKGSGPSYFGSGSLRYQDIVIEGYKVGEGKLDFSLNDKQAALTQLDLRYGGGQITSKRLAVALTGRYELGGDLSLSGVRLEGILDAVKEPDVPLELPLDGSVKVSGFLNGPLAVDLDAKTRFSSFVVYDGARVAKTPENTVIRLPAGSVDGQLKFTPEKMSFKAGVDALSGKLIADGFLFLGPQSGPTRAEIHVKGEKLSITELKKISTLEFGGTANVNADIWVFEKTARIMGDLNVADLEIEQLWLGNVKGRAQFQNELLTFDDLTVSASGPVTGNGHLDFGKPDLEYQFNVDMRRAEMDQIFKMFHKQKLGFAVPKGGEVQGRVVIAGGRDGQELEVRASGQGKNFNWYDEDWSSSLFSLIYRPNEMDISRLLLLKKAGGIEVRGRVTDKQSRLGFVSHGLRLEELNRMEKTPIAGEIVGQVTFDGQVSKLEGNGALRLTKTTFRGNALADSELRLRHQKGEAEIQGTLLGERLKGKLSRIKSGGDQLELGLNFKDFDFAPFISTLMQKDIPTFSDISGTGDLKLKGDFSSWEKLRGSGTLEKITLGLRGTPMSNIQPIEIKVADGAISVNRFQMVGRDGQLSMDFVYRPGSALQASMDGKVDLEFLQPFIPGLEYGKGKVSTALRLSGKPQAYDLLGNISLDDGMFRITGVGEEFRSSQLQLSLSQDRINVDRFEAMVGGGKLIVDGDVRINKFRTLIPNLRLLANRVGYKQGNYLTTRLTGEFQIKGSAAPYEFTGKCELDEAKLSRFDTTVNESSPTSQPLFAFNIHCNGNDRLFVATDVMDAEFSGNFHLVGNTNKVGLLGGVEAIKGSLLFRDTKFEMDAGTAKFESSESILPRFNVSGRALVKELKAQGAQEYDVNLQVLGVPSDYKIRLTSSPPLPESDLISLLLLGVTGRGQEGNYVDLGSTIAGQIPIQSKLQSEFGVDIRINNKAAQNQADAVSSTSNPFVPNVQIQKDVTKRTKVSYSNTLEAVPQREFKIEQMLDDNFSFNGSVVNRSRGSTEAQSVQSYGLDFRYRFSFE